MVETSKKRLSMWLLMVFAADVGAAEPRPAEAVHDDIPEMDCVIEPSEVVDVGSAVPGLVEFIHADRGDRVEKGAVVFELESSVERASLELARTRATLNTAIELRRESAEFGDLTQQRNQKLMRKSAIALHDMDRLKTEARIAELQLRQERDNKRLAELEYQQARAIFQRRTIRSPVEGVVLERFKSVGEYVEDSPLLRVAQLHPLHVEVIVPVDYMGRIHKGMSAQVTPVFAGTAVQRATVERVDPVADAASGTFGVRLSLPNPNYQISAGLRCRISLLSKEPQNAEGLADGGTAMPKLESDASALQPASAQSSGPSDSNEAAAVVPTFGHASAPAACYSLGPFADKEQARQLSESLESDTDRLALRRYEVSQNQGHFVLAAAEPGASSAAGLLNRLDLLGIQDRFVIAAGKYKGRVSLGFYRSHQSASRLQQRLADKGLDTDIIPRHKQVQQFWLDVTLKEGGDLPRRFQETATFLPPGVLLNPVTCSPQLVMH